MYIVEIFNCNFIDLLTACGIANNHSGIFRPVMSAIKKKIMVPKTPEMANRDVTHERCSLSNVAPPTNGEVSFDSRVNKLELVHPAP